MKKQIIEQLIQLNNDTLDMQAEIASFLSLLYEEENFSEGGAEE